MTPSESLVWIALIGAAQAIVIVVLGGVGTGIQIWWTSRQAKAAAVKVEAVKETLETTTKTTDNKLDAQDTKIDDLRHIANGQTLIHLRAVAASSGIIAGLLRREAERTEARADIDAANKADQQHSDDEKNFAEHEATLKALSSGPRPASAAPTGKQITIGITTPQVVVNEPKEG